LNEILISENDKKRLEKIVNAINIKNFENTHEELSEFNIMKLHTIYGMFYNIKNNNWATYKFT